MYEYKNVRRMKETNYVPNASAICVAETEHSRLKNLSRHSDLLHLVTL
jgi:hypothetical protein